MTKSEVKEERFKIKDSDFVVIIELFDRSFSSFSDAIFNVCEKHKSKKIFLMQSIEKEGEPFKVVIVFEF
jgi:hypothetical protein